MSIFNTKKYLLALSGGPDSMALLHFYRNHIKVACIVNYHKRTDSDNDVLLAIKLCNKYKVKYEVYDVPNQIYDNNNENFQSLARHIRYEFFYQTAIKYNIKKILVAHHFDDFLETAYMQKMKHSKALYYGIQKKSQFKDLTIYRPFLFEFRKNTLKRICDEYKIEYAIDSSNDSDVYERNRVRKIISTWDIDTVYNFKKEIFKYNKQNSKQYKKNIKCFNQFVDSIFSIDYYNKLDDTSKYYLIYNYLGYLNKVSNRSSDKINAIKQFLDNESKKKLRIDNYSCLAIRKHKIVCIENETQQLQNDIQD